MLGAPILTMLDSVVRKREEEEWKRLWGLRLGGF